MNRRGREHKFQIYDPIVCCHRSRYLEGRPPPFLNDFDQAKPGRGLGPTCWGDSEAPLRWARMFLRRKIWIALLQMATLSEISITFLFQGMAKSYLRVIASLPPLPSPKYKWVSQLTKGICQLSSPVAIHPSIYWLDYGRLLYITADMCLITHVDEICDRTGDRRGEGEGRLSVKRARISHLE